MVKISFQQISYFLTTAETLNFTDASKQLYISQPALSKQISILEQELGFPLFIRNRRHVALTPEGASLYRDWSDMSRLMETSIYNAKLVSNQTNGHLAIGCSDTFDYSDILPPFIQQFRSTYPFIELSIESHSFKTLRESLMNDTVDLILTPYFELDGLPDVHWLKLKDIPLSLVVPNSNPYSVQDHVTLSDLKDETFILISPKDSLGGNERITALARRAGFSINHVQFVPNVTSLVLAVKNGLGVAVCNANFFEQSDSPCQIYPLDIPLDDSFLIAAWKKNRHNISLDLITKMLPDYFGSFIH